MKVCPCSFLLDHLLYYAWQRVVTLHAIHTCTDWLVPVIVFANCLLTGATVCECTRRAAFLDDLTVVHVHATETNEPSLMH